MSLSSYVTAPGVAGGGDHQHALGAEPRDLPGEGGARRAGAEDDACGQLVVGEVLHGATLARGPRAVHPEGRVGVG
jgi:hypothetical protein